MPPTHWLRGRMDPSHTSLIKVYCSLYRFTETLSQQLHTVWRTSPYRICQLTMSDCAQPRGQVRAVPAAAQRVGR